MTDIIQTKHPYVFQHEDGTSTVFQLTTREMEQIGFSMIFHANTLLPLDDRPIFQQQKIMDVERPKTAIVVQTDADGKRSVAVVWKMNDMRPVWLWYDADIAIQLGQDILTAAADDRKKPN